MNEPLSPQYMYDALNAIDANPWNQQVRQELFRKALQVDSLPPKNLQLDQAALNGYKKLIGSFRGGMSLEAKYRLLAQETLIDPRYRGWSRPFAKSIWYDFTQGYVYGIHLPKESLDPFASSPPSIYEATGNLAKNRRDPGQVIVEVGSGPGHLSRELAPHCAQLIAIDKFSFLHDVARERATEKGITNVEYRVGDITQGIPADNESADILVSNGLTAFIPQELLPLYTQEVKRVLKPGGVSWEPEMHRDLAQEVYGSYLKSPKSLLAYMIGELMTSPGAGVSGAYPHQEGEVSAAYRSSGFRSRTLEITHDGFLTGVAVVAYSKP